MNADRRQYLEAFKRCLAPSPFAWPDGGAKPLVSAVSPAPGGSL